MSIKISIVTPNYNQAAFLERTILSVLNQGYENLEYIIIDGGSTDHSVEIIKKYQSHLHYWVSEKDAGMYDAINKGFARSSGAIMGWINSDDILLPGALATVSEVFETFPQVNWITGLPASIDERDRIVSFQPLQAWSRNKILSGQYKWIQQESTYWRRGLWEKAGSRVNDKVTLAADFELWCRFTQYEKLFSVQVAMAGFRKRSVNQKSFETLHKYLAQVQSVLAEHRTLLTSKENQKINLIRVLRRITNNVGLKLVKSRCQRLLNKLEELPPVIRVDRATQKMKIGASNKSE